ncbi:MAG TPA: hypothetical protein DCY72_05980 [Ruminococcaceae bacterium]|nr:hypothetical protein [Oscillospiraceae bacterium]
MKPTTKRILISIVFIVIIRTEYIIFNSMNKAMQHNGYQNRYVFLFISSLVFAATFIALCVYWSTILKGKSDIFYRLLRFIIPALILFVVFIFMLNMFFGFLPI